MKTHRLSLMKKIQGKRVWVATDEWTDSAGHAIVNVVLGCSGDIWVAATLQLDCNGPNLGVEHSELGRAVVGTLNNIGVDLQNVIAFVSDSAAVLKKAFDEVISKVCVNARWVPCISHALNNVGRALVAGLDGRMVNVFERGYPFLHAKRQAARRRRWFAFLKVEHKRQSIPPKYISTRWTIWRDCAEWYLEYFSLFGRFIVQEIGVCFFRCNVVVNVTFPGSAEGEKLDYMKNLFTKDTPQLLATMAYAVEVTSDLCELINVSQKTSTPVVTVMVHRLAALEATLRCKPTKYLTCIVLCFMLSGPNVLHPRVEEALTKVTDEAVRKSLIEKFDLARQGIHVTQTTLVSCFKCQLCKRS